MRGCFVQENECIIFMCLVLEDVLTDIEVIYVYSLHYLVRLSCHKIYACSVFCIATHHLKLQYEL
jgi:hypothetical protein